MTGQYEIEAKFTAPPDAIERLLVAREIGRFSLSPSSDSWHGDLYFDTSDGKLGVTGASLRIRRSEGGGVMTFKAGGRRTGNAVSRLEDEVSLSADELRQAGDRSIDIEPAPSPLARGRQVAGNSPLIPVARLRTHRTVMIATSGDSATIELAVDRSTATRVQDGRKVEFVEIEAELKHGDESGLHEFTEALALTFPGIQPSTITKLARALDG